MIVLLQNVATAVYVSEEVARYQCWPLMHSHFTLWQPQDSFSEDERTATDCPGRCIEDSAIQDQIPNITLFGPPVPPSQ